MHASNGRRDTSVQLTSGEVRILAAARLRIASVVQDYFIAITCATS
jgi:hypothetical protein